MATSSKSFLDTLKLKESTVSTVLGILVVLVTAGLIINYWRTTRSGGQVGELSPTPAPGEVRIVERDGQMVPENLPASHTVASGEHLWGIAEKYYTSGYNWVDIAEANSLEAPYYVSEGQSLTLPQVAIKTPTSADGVVAEASPEPEEPSPTPAELATTGSPDAIESESYTVVKGDYLWEIAIRAYGDGYKWVEIARANNLDNPDVIHPGNVLTLPR